MISSAPSAGPARAMRSVAYLSPFLLILMVAVISWGRSRMGGTPFRWTLEGPGFSTVLPLIFLFVQLARLCRDEVQFRGTLRWFLLALLGLALTFVVLTFALGQLWAVAVVFAVAMVICGVFVGAIGHAYWSEGNEGW